MSSAETFLNAANEVTFSGVPEGLEARLIAEILAAGPGVHLHIARDDSRMAALADCVWFFAPEAEILSFPAWDCLPYDRISPNPAVSARRMDVLSHLTLPPKGPRLVLATVNASLQRLPPRRDIEGSSLEARPGERLELDRLQAYFRQNGYVRTGNVMEAGEYAIRGGIVDVFPPGTETPLRLDFFGDELESARHFDPASQRTTGAAQALRLVPVSEVPLDAESISRFRQRYRALFGAATDDDPVFLAVSEGRRHAGIEHWLPLMHEYMDTLFDYLPEVPVTHDHLVGDALSARVMLVQDYYEARRQMLDVEETLTVSAPYKPVPPEQLYLDEDAWRNVQAGRSVGRMTPFREPTAESVIQVGGRAGHDFAAERRSAEGNAYDAVKEYVDGLAGAGLQLLIAGYSRGSADRLAAILSDHGFLALRPVDDARALAALGRGEAGLSVLPLEHGFLTDDLAVISEQDILGDRLVRTRRVSRRAENFLTEASEISLQDLVVHVEHGIGRYLGLQTIDVGGAPHDCLAITYHGGDRLYLPVENIEVLSRYGSEDLAVPLDRLGGAAWQARKARLKQRLKDMAEELIKVAAERELKTARAIARPDGLYDEFCAAFPYQETEDQLRSIDEVFDDLQRQRPMDRLICGDVGFGKTEVALRSAFATVMAGGQVAVVVPTTLLSRQHYQTFTERFADLPVRMGQLSRMVPAKQAAEVKEELKSGIVDIVIGTHALLGKSIRFKDLALVIVDEEQHFGVRHKEQLKALRSDVHVLTLTATPIPRTLQLAFSGVKDLSLIATPPIDRLAVRTFVLPFDALVIREALLREHYRGGQAFYVCPRIEQIPEIEAFLKEHVPEVRFAVAHGRLAATTLEDVMADFYDGKFDVLICTSIIESGLDIPTVNTLVMHRADMFGLAQLYQLRGRIGRAKQRAYAYFTLSARKPLTVAAEKRLKVLQSLDSIGAGFSLASHDLDIRGAGNLLGEEQSGHIKEVGLELYQQMLEDAVAAARTAPGGGGGDGDASDWSPQLNIGASVLIPDWYVSDLGVRLGLYRRIARLEGQDQVDSFGAELIDRFGKLPGEVEHLLKIVAIKSLCRQANVEKLDAGPRGATLAFRRQRFANPGALVDFINEADGTVKLRPDHTLVVARTWEEVEMRLQGVEAIMRRLVALALQEPERPSAA